jgi:hypothetical protein
MCFEPDEACASVRVRETVNFAGAMLRHATNQVSR